MPDTVATAIKWMYFGAVVSLIFLPIKLSLMGSMRSRLQEQGNLSPDQIDTVVRVGTGMAVVFSLIGTGLWIWMAKVCRDGRSWGRVLSTVFMAIGTLSFFYSLTQDAPGWAKLIDILPVAVGIAATVSLWREESRSHFDPFA
ncbi:hypothetical protein [Actinomadura oligospora]|uniref:hypothetical protein n=1 Tax=Actinomadura oligospora TaxID=111804 RepID=UPI00047D18BF|nr:hypothetical protein [Actinomadura oligospora]